MLEKVKLLHQNLPVLFGAVNYRADFQLSIYLWPPILLQLHLL